MRAFITGITGFTGKYLADELLERGYTVSGFAIHSPRMATFSRAYPAVATHAGDLLAVDTIVKALEKAAPDHVYHLAAFTSTANSFKEPVRCHQVNVVGTAALLEAIRRTGARPRVLLVSSAQVYGKAQGDRIDEDTPLRPISPYGASKAASEMVGLAALEADRTPVMRVRAFNYLGPGQDPGFAVPAFARQVARAERPGGTREIRVGNLSPLRDLSDVRDVVRAYTLLMERGEPGEVYNVCSGRGVSMRQVLDALVERARVPVSVVEDPALFRPSEIERLIGDPARLERATGYRPSRPLSETLDFVLDDWRAQSGADA